MRKGWVPALGIILCFFPVSSVRAQKDAGTITGTVRDATGGVVPGVAITVSHTQTSISFATITGATGTYTVPALRVGEYVVTAELTGFKKEVRRGIVVQVNQVAVADLTLDVGEVSDTAEVTVAAPLIQTQSVTLGDVVDEKQVKELPLNGRNFVQLLTLTAGATPGISRTAQSTTWRRASGVSLSSRRSMPFRSSRCRRQPPTRSSG